PPKHQLATSNYQLATPSHTTPHFRRNSQSAAVNPSSVRNTMGISQSSFVSRTEIPASEYEISRGSLSSSPPSQYRPPVCSDSFSRSALFCSVWKFSATPS